MSSPAEEKPQAAAENSPDVLHAGDLVLLKCHVRVGGQNDNGTGFLYADGIRSQVSMLECDRIQGTGLDIREFLFMVVGQLQYARQKDLKKRLAQVEERNEELHGSELSSFHLLEGRAKLEEEQNMASYTDNRRTLCYGDVIQLMHVRTKRYVSLNKHHTARLDGSARLVELQHGSAKSWMRLKSSFKHKMPGHPVIFDEQVLISMGKRNWNLNVSRALTAAREVSYEVNCAEKGKGFTFVLYNRSVFTGDNVLDPGAKLALNFGLALTLSLPHSHGLITASCSPQKREPYLRTSKPIGLESLPGETCAKSIWVLEHVGTAFEQGITYLQTPVQLRHYGSGRYLSVSVSELRAKKMLGREDKINEEEEDLQRQPSQSTAPLAREFRTCQADLVDLPGAGCVFILEPTEITGSLESGIRPLVPRDEHTPILLRWDNPFGAWSLWLSCNGLTKGRRSSQQLIWSETKLPRDAITLKVVSDTPWMVECDVVSEHAATLRRYITPRCVEFDNVKLAAEVCARLEGMLIDMIHYLSGSAFWRSSQARDFKAPDVMSEAAHVVPYRQQLIRELKYMDATVDLFQELVKVTPTLKQGSFKFRERMLMLSTKPLKQAAMLQQSSNVDYEQTVDLLKTHCLKLVIRMWLFCFLHNSTNAAYFHKNGWLATIDSMNGHGLGASTIFAALLNENPNLVRSLDRSAMHKFVNFIRALGPLDAWLSFLNSICAPHDRAIFQNQQAILSILFFPGQRCPDEQRLVVEANRRDLLISFRLLDPVGVKIGPASKHAREHTRLEECLGHAVLKHGVHAIAICWTAPDEWVIGEGVLYHSPSTLGLPVQEDLEVEDGRGDWVLLEDLMWVLQPDKCCEAVTGVKWEDMQRDSSMFDTLRHTRRIMTGVQPGMLKGRASVAVARAHAKAGKDSESRFEHLVLLAKYLLAQLCLVTDLVKQRQSNCMMALQEEYTFELCISGAANERLPDTVRAAFVNIIVDLWVDRYPHHGVPVPCLLKHPMDDARADLAQLPVFTLHRAEAPDSWSEEHLNQLPQEVVSFYRLGQPYKMEAALRILRDFFYAGPAVEQMVYSKEGRTTLMSAMLRLLLNLLRFGFVFSRHLLQELQGPVLRCLDGRIDVLHPIDRPLTPKPEAKAQFSLKEKQVLTNVVGVWQSSTTKDETDEVAQLTNKKFVLAHWPAYDKSADRYAFSDAGVTNAKVQMLHVITHMMDAGLHIQITECSAVLSSANLDEHMSAHAQQAAIHADQLVAIFEKPFIDLRAYGLNQPNVMLLDIMMYEDPAVFKLALQVLSQNCMQTVTLSEVLKNVMLLIPAQLQLFQTLKAEVCTLGKLLNSFENWAVDDYFSTVDFQKFQQFQRICLKIRNLCDLGDSSSSPSEVQRMLSETELFTHICSTLRFDPRDYVPSCQDLLGKIVALMCSVAAKFANNNPKIQNMMHQEVPNITSLMNTHADAAILMAAVFKNNQTLCEQVPPSLITEVGKLIVRERRQGNWAPWYLSVYTTITSVHDSSVRRNQTLIVEELQKLTPAETLHLLQDHKGQSRLMILIAKFRSFKELPSSEVLGDVTSNDAEVLYYIRCLELLVALCVGPTHENLVSKAFASYCFSRRVAVQLITGVYEAKEEHDKVAKGSRSVRLHLAIRWFQLLHRTLYDVDATLMDIPFLVSHHHTDFLRLMLRWLQDLLGKDLGSVASLIDEQEEECLREILNCVGTFFITCYAEIVAAVKHADFVVVIHDFALFFRPFMRGPTVAASRIRDTQLLLVTAYRTLNATEVEPHYSDFALKEMSRIAKRPMTAEKPSHIYWHEVRKKVMADPRIQGKIDAEQREFGNVIFNIGMNTDPERPDYVGVIPRSSDKGLPDHVDFRRNHVTMEQVLRRIVKFSTDNLVKDFESIRRVQTFIKAVLHWARNSDETILQECHKQFVNAGVTDLIIAMLDAKTPEDIDAEAWHLLAEVLQGHHGAGVTVAKPVQAAILSSLVNGDDSGMWATFEEFLRLVIVKVKSVKLMKLMANVTPAEIILLKEYETCLHHAVMAMEAVRLTVEGHYFPMQQYLFAQVGNHRSCNVLEIASNLLARICKDHAAADMLFESEMDCMDTALALLGELAQGPNMRNQEFLSTVGLIETIFSILGSHFASLQKRHGDIYPGDVRKLKAQCMQTMQSLLEGRSDTKIHHVMLQRCDTFVLRERMTFLYLYYVLGSVGVSTERIKSENHAAMPVGDKYASLFDATADPTVVYKVLEPSISVAEELLEDMDELELAELFSEGLNVLVLVFQLSHKSVEFEKLVTPVPEHLETFQNDPKKYLSMREFQRECSEFHRRAIFRHAFYFLARFVKTIEVVLNGQLQHLHFPRPLTEMWYVFGMAKERIENSVPLGAKQAKMKKFILMCQKSHSESKLIRLLSRFSVCPSRNIRWAQRHLWDSAHRPFQTFLKDDAAKIEQLLSLQLFLSVALTAHTGFFLVPLKDPGAMGPGLEWPSSDGLAWSSTMTFALAETMGALHFISIALWLSLTASVKIPLNYEGAQLQYPERSCMSWIFQSLFETISDAGVISRLLLLLSTGTALFMEQFWLYGVLLVDLFYQNSTLGDVCRCILSKAHSLSMSFLGAVIVTYVYAALGYWAFREDFGHYCDVDMHICVQNVLYQGTRNGIIGLSSMLKPVYNDSKAWTGRVAFDISFFVVFGIMILNTIVAQIVNTFYELRGETEARDKMRQTQAFISCLDREVIESVAQARGISNGFEYHETQKQNKWDYMAFIYHLREKDAGDYSGPETQIRQMIEIGDIGWMPIGRSMMLDEHGEQDANHDLRDRVESGLIVNRAKVESAKEQRAVMQSQLMALETQVDERMAGMEAELRQLVQNLTKARHAARASVAVDVAGVPP